MSSSILKIISTIPSYTAEKNFQHDAITFLAGLYNLNQIELITTDSIEFIDQGQNFESISCLVCKQDIEIEAWQGMMDLAFQHQFTDLTIITACCNKETSLNDLNYQWPAGFAKFVITISESENDIPQNELKELENIFGTPLKMIRARY